MWFFLTKSELKREFKKIKDRFLKSDESLSDLEKEVNSNKEKIARLEGALAVILNKSQSQKSQSQPVSVSLTKSQDKIETKIINNLKRNKKAIVIAEINKLKDSHSLTDMYEIIVKEKGICSKASYYRYIASLKSLKSLKTN